MSTHHMEDLLIDAQLDVIARGWLADCFKDPDSFDDEEKAQYKKLRAHIHEKIHEVLGEFRRGLNSIPTPDADDDDDGLEPHCDECGGLTEQNPDHQVGCSRASDPDPGPGHDGHG